VIHRVPLSRVPDVWPALEEYAVRACEYHPFFDPESLFELLMAGYGQLFVATDPQGIQGFVIVEVIRFPKVAAGNVVAAGGRLGFLKELTGELLTEMEKWSAEHGATMFSISGRVGWTRVTKRLGFETAPTMQAWRRIKHGQQGRSDSNH
jgi:hypothetical protein